MICVLLNHITRVQFLGNADLYKKEMSKPQSLALGMLIICQ